MNTMHKAGTGTQYHIEASPPCHCMGEAPDADTCGDVNHEHPNVYRFDGQTYKVGHDYLDTEIGDVVELTEVVRKSSWCHTGDADEGTLEFHFEGERYGSYVVRPANVQADPDEMPLDERFVERYTSPAPMGAPNPPW
jgi:hypothetical protein